MMFFDLFNIVSIFVMFATVLSIPHRHTRSFTLYQTTPKPYIKSGPAHLLSAYQRLNATVPEKLKTAAAVNNGNVIASPSESDAAYLSLITIGQQTFDVAVDTGSDLLWVYSSKLPSANRQTYNPSSSPTSRLPQYHHWATCYGGPVSCVTGDLYIENVIVGGITSSNQLIGAVTAITPSFTQPKSFEGILGLSISRDSKGNLLNTTFFDNIKSSLAAPLFTADLKKGKPGSYDFGFIDGSKYIGNITYVPVNADRGFWECEINGYAIGDEEINLISINVIVDTGSTAVLVSDQMLKFYYATVPKAVYTSTEFGYVFPCGSVLPDLTFVIGGHKAVIPGYFFEYSPISDSNITCYGSIQSIGGASDSAFILGDVFLKSQFVVFEVENDEPRLGFAAKIL